MKCGFRYSTCGFGYSRRARYEYIERCTSLVSCAVQRPDTGDHPLARITLCPLQEPRRLVIARQSTGRPEPLVSAEVKRNRWNFDNCDISWP